MAYIDSRTPEQRAAKLAQLRDPRTRPAHVNVFDAVLYTDDVVSVSTFNAWRQQGKGPRFIKVGSHLVYYRLDELDRWLKAQCQQIRTKPRPIRGRKRGPRSSSSAASVPMAAKGTD